MSVEYHGWSPVGDDDIEAMRRHFDQLVSGRIVLRSNWFAEDLVLNDEAMGTPESDTLIWLFQGEVNDSFCVLYHADGSVGVQSITGDFDLPAEVVYA